MEYKKHQNIDLLSNLSKLYEEELTDNLKMKEYLDRNNFSCRDLQEKIIISSNVLKSIDEIKFHVEIGKYDHIDLVHLLLEKVDNHLNNIKKLNNEQEK